MKLLVPLVLLLALGYPATAEVVPSFEGQCNNFFVMNTPPTGPTGVQYRKICQKKTNAYEFATLYDTIKRIPVYSAYKFQTYARCKRSTAWYIEPQLDDQNGGEIMALEDTVDINLRGQRQALNGDFSRTKYDKGHLVPVRHRNSPSCLDATFTLTNAAPQYRSFNRGQWSREEGRVSVLLTTNCVNRGLQAFVVTGVIPGNTLLKERVNIPKYFWSAYCCIDNNNIRQLSGAHYGKNDNTNRVYPTSISALNTLVGFNVFPNECNQ